jgi:alkanesulfonate monooxygenase SsuD/methylene tetrahydromethanopterin reductase-like flavin-dependent oxidoreductase (luciferase family)
MLAVSVVSADTDERAQHLAGPNILNTLNVIKGRRERLPSPEKAAAYSYTEMDRQMVAAQVQGSFVGSPETVRKGLEQLLADVDADELMLSSIMHGHTDRVHSYELVAELAR